MTFSGSASTKSPKSSAARARPVANSRRARAHVREARPRFQIERQRALALAKAFFAASRTGDVKVLGDMLADDVTLYADGGGKRPAAREPILGSEAVIEAFEHLAPLFRENKSHLVKVVFVCGLPGFVTLEADGEYSTTALLLEEEKIEAIYVMRNPDKLKHLH